MGSKPLKNKYMNLFIGLGLVVFSLNVFAAIPRETISPDQSLYAKVIEAYRQGDKLLLNKSVRLLIKNYPQSVHADNALYLNGMLALSKSEYKRALKNFVLLQKFYPNGNKLPAALMGKGISYRKLGKLDKAEKAFKMVQARFPKSPEFYQSGLQLKLLKQEE